MAIAYPLSLPSTPAITSIRFGGASAVAVTESPFTFEEQRFVHAGQRWLAEINLRPMKRPDAEDWNSFLMKLNGKEGTFLMGDPAGTTPRGSAGGTPQVNGASQTGKTLNTKGWPASTSGVLLAGDYIQLDSGATSKLHKVLNDANSDAGGLAALDIWPSLRSSPADSATIVASAAKGVFRLAENLSGWDVNAALIYGASFRAVEVIT